MIPNIMTKNPCLCLSLRVGAMVITVIELIMFFLISLVGIFYGSAIPSEVTAGHEKILSAEQLNHLKNTFYTSKFVYATLAATGITGIICSSVLLFGILECSVKIMRLWLAIRIATTVINIVLCVSGFLSLSINYLYAGYFAVTVGTGIYSVLIIRALLSEIKRESTYDHDEYNNRY